MLVSNFTHSSPGLPHPLDHGGISLPEEFEFVFPRGMSQRREHCFIQIFQVNYTKIAANGIHEESWAILYYVTHLLKVFAQMPQFMLETTDNMKKKIPSKLMF